MLINSDVNGRDEEGSDISLRWRPSENLTVNER
jgi:hypothetical protein